ncbi:MAG: SLC13 family permease [Veillonellales bacterium]
MSPALITLLVLGVVALLFVTEIIPLEITAMGGAIALGILGIIPMKVVFSGLSNSTVVLFAGMFVIGAAMFHTGLAQKLGAAIVRLAGTGENSLMFGTMLIAALISSVSSNTGATAALMPVIIGICSVARMPASRQLMPLAYGAGLGGMITLVGTPPNIIAAGTLKAAGFQPFGFFEFAWIGIPLTIAGIAYMMFAGKYFLPKEQLTPQDSAADAAPIAASQTAAAAGSDSKKMWITGATLIGVVIVMALDLPQLPLEVAAVIGAIILILTKCLTADQAYSGIDWVTIFLFAGMMPIATALDQSGAGKLIADQVVSLLGGHPHPLMVTAVLFLLSGGLTQFMSNTASAALLAPIGISIAQSLGASPYAVLMAIAVAASCAFITPVGTPPNTLVLGPGRYKFMDYVKAGSGLTVVCFVLSLVIIPIVWPFFPK